MLIQARSLKVCTGKPLVISIAGFLWLDTALPFGELSLVGLALDLVD